MCVCVWDIHIAHPLLASVATVIYIHTHMATYVFEMAKNSFCPSGGTLADSAVTSLRFSSI